MRRAWDRIGRFITRMPVALALAGLVAAALISQVLFLQDNMEIKVEANDLLPADHPKNGEFDFIRDNFAGSSRGFFVVAEAPLERLREVVPEIAHRFEELPSVEFIRWRIERDYFQDHLLLFQAQDDLERQLHYLESHRADVDKIVASLGSLSELLSGIADIVEGEQSDLAEDRVDEREKDAKLARDVTSMRPLLEAIPPALDRIAAGDDFDARSLGVPIGELMLRGWFDKDDQRQLDRELIVPEDVWDQTGPTLAVIWIGTTRSDYDAEFTAGFMREAERTRGELAVALPDVALHFTGGIASYRKYVNTVTSDFDVANAWGLLSVFVLLVLGFRAFTPFVMLMLLLFIGTTGTLVFQNWIFGGVNMIATAGTLAVIGIGSDYGVILLTSQRRILAELRRDAPPDKLRTTRGQLSLVRRSISEALVQIGTSTSAGALVSALSFLALAGAEVVPLFRSLLGMPEIAPESFQPIRELALGGALGLIYCLLLMLLALPATLYLSEVLSRSKVVRRVTRTWSPVRRKLARRRGWLRWRGRWRDAWRTNWEQRWFRSLALWAVRRRFPIFGISFVVGIVALVLATGVRWSTGQHDVEPLNSRPIEVSRMVEERFGKSFENVLVYGSLDAARALHAGLAARLDSIDANVGDVYSIDDYLPANDEPQDEKVAAAQAIGAQLEGLRPAVPSGLMVLTRTEQRALAEALAAQRAALSSLAASGETARVLERLGRDLDRLLGALADGDVLEPSRDWAGELVRPDPAILAVFSEQLGEIASEPFMIGGALASSIDELKALSRALRAAMVAGDGSLLRRDLRALALALEELAEDPGGDCRRSALANGDPCRLRDLLAQVEGYRAWARGPASSAASGEVLSTVAAEPVRAPLMAVHKFLADSAIYEMELGSDAFVNARDALEATVALLTLRLRRERHPPVGLAPVLEAAYRLRRSLDTLRSFAASSNFASVGPVIPDTALAADRLIAALESLPTTARGRADAVVQTFDELLTSELFDRFVTMRRATVKSDAPLSVADVPESALEMLRGRDQAADMFLVRVLPRVSMLQREPFEAVKGSIEQSIAALPPEVAAAGVGYSGFEVLLNLATDYLEGTFNASMIAVCLLVLLVVGLLFRSIAGTLVTIAPVALGTLMTLAMMAVLDIPISIFTVVAIPIVIGVGIDSSILVFTTYWGSLEDKKQRSIEDTLGSVGKAVTLNSLTTVVPFAALLVGDMQGLIAVGLILSIGVLFCLFAKLLLLPALISIMHDFVVPASQYASYLWPSKLLARLFRGVFGRWHERLPFNDSGIVLEPQDELMVATIRRPPLNLLDAAMVAKGTQYSRLVVTDPEVRAVVVHSGLPRYYTIEDSDGKMLEDERGRVKKIPAAEARAIELDPGQRLVGPVRPLGAGADLKVLATDPVNAFFTLKGAVEIAQATWYSPKPFIFVAEGDAVAGWLELALYSNYFVVTKNARIGAPEVKAGLTLPFGSHALQFRAGARVAQQLMGSGELIGGEEAVRLGIADALVPDGEDALEYAKRVALTPELRDAVHQTAMLRQYGPPVGKLISKSVRNYVRLLRSAAARERMQRFTKAGSEAT